MKQRKKVKQDSWKINAHHLSTNFLVYFFVLLQNVRSQLFSRAMLHANSIGKIINQFMFQLNCQRFPTKLLRNTYAPHSFVCSHNVTKTSATDCGICSAWTFKVVRSIQWSKFHHILICVNWFILWARALDWVTKRVNEWLNICRVTHNQWCNVVDPINASLDYFEQSWKIFKFHN